MAKRGVAVVVCVSTIWFACGSPSNPSSSEQRQTAAELGAPILLPTGALITPLEAEGATFQALNPGLPNRPDFTAGQATSTALSPDGRLLLVLTTGYNRNYGPDGRLIPSESNEYVFIFDVSTEPPVQQQVLQVPNTFHGIAWSPAGDRFVVSGGPNDNIHIYDHASGEWAESFAVSLRHSGGLGLGVGPQSAGLAITQSGNRVVVANFENDSVCIVDLGLRAVSEVELRPAKIDPQQRGVPGGEFPFWVATQGDDKAYVTSMRDREVAVIDLRAEPPRVVHRISVGGQPNRMILNGAGTRLYVANGSSDSVSVINTASDQVIETLQTTAPTRLHESLRGFKGANPNSMALSPDERTLYVTNGGTNSVAVVRLAAGRTPSEVVGLIPTGWYPNSVSVSADGHRLFVVNGKGLPGPNPGACRDTLSIDPSAQNACTARNQYVLQLEKAGLLSLPVPTNSSLRRLELDHRRSNHRRDREDPVPQLCRPRRELRLGGNESKHQRRASHGRGAPAIQSIDSVVSGPDAAGDRCRGARGTGRHLLCRVPLGCGVAPGALGAQLWLLRGFGPLRACRRRSAVCANRDQSGRAGHPAILPDQGLAPGHYRPVLPWLRPEAGRLLQLPRVGARVRPVRGKRRSPGARIRPIPACSLRGIRPGTVPRQHAGSADGGQRLRDWAVGRKNCSQSVLARHAGFRDRGRCAERPGSRGCASKRRLCRGPVREARDGDLQTVQHGEHGPDDRRSARARADGIDRWPRKADGRCI